MEIRFRRGVRLNLYPFRWCKLLILTVDKPDEFVESVSEKLTQSGAADPTGDFSDQVR